MPSTRRTHLVLGLLALTLMALGGCAIRRGAVRADARHVRALVRQVEIESRCPAQQLTATMLSVDVAQVHGCGMVREYSFISRGRLRGRWRAIRPVWERAAVELACPAPQLVITAPSATQRSVAGCGRSAIYGLSCAAECLWTMRRWAGEPGGAAVASAAPVTPGAAGAGADIRETLGAAPEAAESPPAEGGASEPATSASGPTEATGGAESETAAAPPAETAGTTASVPADPRDPSSWDVPDPPAPGSPEASLRTFLDDRRAAIRGCTGPGPIVVRASWASDGYVTFELEPPLAGTPADACLRTALGRARFDGASGPGMVRHSLL